VPAYHERVSNSHFLHNLKVKYTVLNKIKLQLLRWLSSSISKAQADYKKVSPHRLGWNAKLLINKTKDLKKNLSTTASLNKTESREAIDRFGLSNATQVFKTSHGLKAT
jgi:hypothetical protein